MFNDHTATYDPSRAYKQFYKQQLDDLMREKEQQKKIEDQRQKEEKQLYNERLAQISESEKAKQLTYKNYYRMLMSNQQQRSEQYVSPFDQREVMKAEHVKKALEEHKRRDEQQQIEKKRREDMMTEDFKQVLKYQMDSKKYNEDVMRMLKNREAEYIEKNTLSPKQVQEIEAIKRRQAEIKYKQDLDKLITEKEQNHLRTIREQNKAFYPKANDSTSHNPLYNPLPFVVQNPYILKQMRRSGSPMQGNRQNDSVGGSRQGGATAPPPSYFAGIGSNNLQPLS